MNSIQYTIRNIPEPVNQALRRRAKRTGKSFNQTVVDALEQASGVVCEPEPRYTDLDWLRGTMTAEDKKAFDEGAEWLDELPDNTEDNFKY